MGKESTDTDLKVDALNHQEEFGVLQAGLENLKDELMKMTAKYEGQKEVTDEGDEALQGLSEKISALLRYEWAEKGEQLAHYPELVELMRQTVHEIYEGTQDISEEAFTLSEEKELLLSLMMSVLAKVGRKEQEHIVMEYTQEAVQFFSTVGLGGLYDFLIERANR